MSEYPPGILTNVNLIENQTKHIGERRKSLGQMTFNIFRSHQSFENTRTGVRVMLLIGSFRIFPLNDEEHEKRVKHRFLTLSSMLPDIQPRTPSIQALKLCPVAPSNTSVLV